MGIYLNAKSILKFHQILDSGNNWRKEEDTCCVNHEIGDKNMHSHLFEPIFHSKTRKTNSRCLRHYHHSESQDKLKYGISQSHEG